MTGQIKIVKTLRENVRHGKNELLELAEISEGTNVSLPLISEEDADFWLQTSQASLDTIWANAQDDVYAERLKK